MTDLKLRAFDRVQKKMHYATIEKRDDGLMIRFAHFDDDEPIYQVWRGKQVWEAIRIKSDPELLELR